MKQLCLFIAFPNIFVLLLLRNRIFYRTEYKDVKYSKNVLLDKILPL